MSKLVTILTFLFLYQFSWGQDTIRHCEFGSTLVTFNSFNTTNYFAPDRPSVEFINGLFFRYTKKRLGLRINASYSDNSTSYATPIGWSDGSSGDINNKDIRIGIGGQFSILKRKEWLYTYADLSYRNIFSTGHNYGGISGANDKFSRTGNGFDFIFGLGFKIKSFKNFYLSPELGFIISNKTVNSESTSMTSGQTKKYNYNETDVTTIMKLHLTVKF